MSAPKETLSVSASPKVRLPFIVALPVTVRLPPIATSAEVVTSPVRVEVSSTTSISVSFERYLSDFCNSELQIFNISCQ